METQRLTVKQDALVRALASGKAKTQRKAAELAGMTESHAAEVLKKPHVAEALDRLKMRQGDSARSIAVRALGKAGSAVDVETPDPLEAVQVAAGAITVAARYAESFETGESPEAAESERRALHIKMQRAFAAGVLLTLRAARQGKTPDYVLQRLRAHLLDVSPT